MAAGAESSVFTTLAFMLQPERAARLVEYQARDNAQPGLIPVVDRLDRANLESATAKWLSNGELQRLVNSLVLKQLLTLPATATAPESVRGIALLEIDGLKKWMHNTVNTSAGNQKANLLFGLSQIEEFEKTPDKFKPAPILTMPDGSPIGNDE